MIILASEGEEVEGENNGAEENGSPENGSDVSHNAVGGAGSTCRLDSFGSTGMESFSRFERRTEITSNGGWWIICAILFILSSSGIQLPAMTVWVTWPEMFENGISEGRFCSIRSTSFSRERCRRSSDTNELRTSLSSPLSTRRDCRHVTVRFFLSRRFSCQIVGAVRH